MRGSALLVAGVFGSNHGFYSSSHVEVTLDHTTDRATSSHKIIQDPIRCMLVKDSRITKRNKVELKRLQLNNAGVGNVTDPNLRKIRLSSTGADTSELWTDDFDFVLATLIFIGDDFEPWVQTDQFFSFTNRRQSQCTDTA